MPSTPSPARLRESLARRSARFGAILDVLERQFPEARIALRFSNELELLVCVLLSAQCTDERVNEATPALFARFRTAADYAAASPEELEPYLQRLGLFRSKARHLVACGRRLVEDHGGALPRTREALAELPGVGWKTAGVVALHAFGEPGLPVDTHVLRLATRMGLTRERSPERIEEELCRLVPPQRQGNAHHLFIAHGRAFCRARNPDCEACELTGLCPRKNLHDRS